MTIAHLSLSTIAGVLLMAAGVAFLLIAAIGLVRLRDPLQRMHSATKAGTLGTALVILGAMLLGEVARPQTGLLTIVFLLVTLPFGAQLLGRAIYVARTPLDGIVDDPAILVAPATGDPQTPPSPDSDR